MQSKLVKYVFQLSQALFLKFYLKSPSLLDFLVLNQNLLADEKWRMMVQYLFKSFPKSTKGSSISNSKNDAIH